MKRVFRPFVIPTIAAVLFVVAAAVPAVADCLVSSGTLLSGGSITVVAPPGHTYRFDYTGAATGSITVVGTLNIVNGTGGTLNYLIFDVGCEPIPALSGWMIGLMGLMLAGIGVQFIRLRR